jgi:hypothetical protein
MERERKEGCAKEIAVAQGRARRYACGARSPHAKNEKKDGGIKPPLQSRNTTEYKYGWLD